MIIDPKIQEQLAGVRTWYVDIDHTIHPYCNDTYGMKFFDFSVEAMIALSPKALQYGRDKLMKMAWDSFKETGLVFVHYMREFDDFDVDEFFKRSHQMMIDNVLPNYFKNNFDVDRARKINEQLEMLRGYGLEFIATTHGSEKYARYILGHNSDNFDGYNVAHHFNHIVGLDSFGHLRQLSRDGTVFTKRHAKYHINTIERTLPPHDGRYGGLSSYGIIDDSPSNIDAPFNRLGMVTVQPNVKVNVIETDDHGHIRTPDLTDILDVMINVHSRTFIGPRSQKQATLVV